MTLDAALEKADRQMDDISDRVLIDAEDFIRDLGATDAECAAWLARKRQDLADARSTIHDMVRVAHATGFGGQSRRVN